MGIQPVDVFMKRNGEYFFYGLWDKDTPSARKRGRRSLNQNQDSDCSLFGEEDEDEREVGND